MPKNTETKKKEKSPKNVSKKAPLQSQITAIGNVVNETTKAMTSVIGIHPVEGISKTNKILDAIFDDSPNPIDENVVMKKGKIILNRDNVGKYIKELLKKITYQVQKHHDQSRRHPHQISLMKLISSCCSSKIFYVCHRVGDSSTIKRTSLDDRLNNESHGVIG